jgi:hypothetical protein
MVSEVSDMGENDYFGSIYDLPGDMERDDAEAAERLEQELRDEAANDARPSFIIEDGRVRLVTP